MSEVGAAIRPTPERMARGGVIVAEGDRFGTPKPWMFFDAAHDALLAEGKITQDAWHGGNKFLAAYYLANGSGVAAQSYAVKVDCSSREDVSKSAADAKLEIGRWSRQLAHPLFDCLENVLAFRVAPSRYARDGNKHPVIGKELLIAALEQFALIA